MPDANTFLTDWTAIDAIEGWLDLPSAAVMDMLLSAQDELKVGGTGILEIGVWKGRSAALMARHLRQEEDLLMVDPWPRTQEVTEGLTKLMGERLKQHSITLFQGTARELGLSLPAGKRFRFIHIDGEHTAAALRADLLFAMNVLEPAGLIVLDDIFFPMYPQLTQELFTFLAQEGRGLTCILLGFKKAVLCRSKFLSAYGDWIYDHAPATLANRGVAVTLCRTTDRAEWPGYSLIPDIGMPRRGHDDHPEDVRR